MNFRHALAALTVVSCAGIASAGYLLEIDTDGADDGVLTLNPGFSFGGDTTIASQTVTSTAFGTTGGDGIFGGNGVNLPDTYLYTYSPDAQADNLAIPAGINLGEGVLSTGANGGGAGTYRVFTTWNFTDNVSGGPITYTVQTLGDAFQVVIDQNNRGDVWILLGEIAYTSGAIIISQTSTSNTFVSMRAYGMLFEAVPTPSAAAVLGLGALGLVRRRR